MQRDDRSGRYVIEPPAPRWAGAAADDAAAASADPVLAALIDRDVSAVSPTQSYNTRALRRLSFLSHTLPPRLRGCGITIDMSTGKALVGRITNAKIDELKALGFIAKERGRRRQAASAVAAVRVRAGVCCRT